MHKLQRRHGLLLFAALVHLIVLVHLLHAQDAPSFQRGEVVRVKSDPQPSEFRVIAIAGDHVRVDRSGIYVNEIWIGLSREMRDSMMETWSSETVPAGHYFVVGEERIETEGRVRISRSSALTGAGNLEKMRE
jgi:hypothetical protein